MNILITAATTAELLPALEIWETLRYQRGSNLSIKCVETGIGSASTVYHTLKELSATPEKHYDLAINIGIAGSIFDSLPLGSVVRITSDYFGDCGIQTASGFQSLFDARLLDANTFPFTSGKLIPLPLSPEWENALTSIPIANGVTVQHLVEGAHFVYPLHLDGIETMEGAAFFYVCMNEHIPCIALRAISNPAGEREKSRWDIPLALSELKKTLAQVFCMI